MDEMLKKQDVLDAIYATMEKTDKPDVVLGLAAAMSTVKQMQAAPVMPAEKQEPCTDAISRQAAIDACLNGWNKDYKEIVADIRELPPVKPAEKVGHWIKCGDIWECSHCHELSCCKANFCPDCGVKMGGEQNE